MSTCYMVSLRFRRKAGTSKSDCSKLAIMALRMMSMEMDSLDARAATCGADSITMEGGGGSGSNAARIGKRENSQPATRQRRARRQICFALLPAAAAG